MYIVNPNFTLKLLIRLQNILKAWSKSGESLMDKESKLKVIISFYQNWLEILVSEIFSK